MPRPERRRAPESIGFPLDGPHLADTSAWSKARNDDSLAQQFDAAARSGLIATCEIIALELLRSARNEDRFKRQSAELALLLDCPVGRDEVARARAVQAGLVAKGHHRGVKPVDLLIAAAAESAGVPLLHYDHDYDMIASVTGQGVRWLAPRGSLP